MTNNSIPFITREDIDMFKDFNNDYPKFCLEFHKYLTNRWVSQDGEELDEYQLKSKNDIAPLLNFDIEEFNSNIGFPSRIAKSDLDDAFTGIRVDDYKMSNISKEYLAYFYNIHLHMDMD